MSRKVAVVLLALSARLATCSGYVPNGATPRMEVLSFTFQRLDDDDTLLEVYILDDVCYRGN